jgi:hypothetical protein
MPPERGFWECFIASKSSEFSSVSLAKPSRSTKSTARSCVVVIEDSILPLLANAGPLYWRSDKLTGSRIYRLSVRVDWSSICNGNLLFSFYSVKSHFQEVLNEISFSRVLEQGDSQIWRLHLLRLKIGSLYDLKISDRKVE